MTKTDDLMALAEKYQCSESPLKSARELRTAIEQALLQAHKEGFDAALLPGSVPDALEASALRLVDALKVYADPGFYHACMFMFDRPTGGFDEDFDYDEEYERAMPGKLARMTLDEVARITK